MSSTKPFAFFFNYEGIDLSKSPFVVQPSTAATIVNMHKGILGSFSASNQGYTALTAVMESGNSVDSLAGFIDASGNKYVLATCNGKVKNVNPTTGALGTDVYTGFTAGNKTSAAALKGTIFISDGAHTPVTWNGSGTATNVTGLPLTNGTEVYDKPKIVSTYTNRLVYANMQGNTSNGSAATFPAHLILSNELAPDTFTLAPVTTDTNGAVIQVSPGDGEAITALRALNLQLIGATYLAIWKEHSLYVLTGTTPSTYKVQLVNNFGCLNNNCVVQVGNDFIFCDEQGIYSFTTATTSGSLQPKVIGSRKIQSEFLQLNTAYKDKAWMVYMKDRNEVWIGIPTGSNTDVDTIIVYALPNNDDEDHIWIIRNGFPHAPKCGMTFNNKFYTGDTAGQIHTWFASSTYNGMAYNYKFQYPFFNYGSQFQYKDVTSLNAWFMLQGDETITFRQQWRGGGNNNIRTISKLINAAAVGAVYGSVSPPAGIYGASYYGSTANLVMVQIPPLGNGLQQQLTLTGTSGNTAPIFLGFSGLVRYGNYALDYR